MKKYKVNVNGTSYEIEIEEIDASQVKAAPKPAADAPSAPVTSAAPSDGKSITSPMPGTILSVNASVGQAVKAGDVLMILEAMKMENEILAPCDGKVSSVPVAKGASVESGTLLCVIA